MSTLGGNAPQPPGDEQHWLCCTHTPQHPGGHPPKAWGLLGMSGNGEAPEAPLLPESHRVTSGLLTPLPGTLPSPSRHHGQGGEGKDIREKKSTLGQQIPALLPAEPLHPVYETTAANPTKQRDSRPRGCCLRGTLVPSGTGISAM